MDRKKIIETWKERWTEGFKPYAEAIEEVYDKCMALTDKLERMACFAEALHNVKKEKKISATAMLESVRKRA